MFHLAAQPLVRKSYKDPIETFESNVTGTANIIATGQVPRTDGREGLRVLRVLNAGQRSLNEGGKVCGLSDKTSVPELEISDPGYFVHETSLTDENVFIDRGTKIWHFSHILSGSHIGKNCNIGQNAVIGPDVIIGNNCKIQNNVSVFKGVTLEDGVFCGPSMVFTNVYNPRAEIRKMDQIRPTLVKKGASIGANATVVCGNTVGRYAFIGAGAVVNKNVPDYALAVGNPARQIGWVCECGERLGDDLKCSDCGKSYEKAENGVRPLH